MSVRIIPGSGTPTRHPTFPTSSPTSSRASTGHLTSATLPSRHVSTSGRTGTDHLTPFTQPARTINVATERFAPQTPVFSRDPYNKFAAPRGTPVTVIPERTTHVSVGRAKSRPSIVVVKDTKDSCWTKFVAFLALIFCCGLLTKAALDE
jgi:hypothetical protein